MRCSWRMNRRHIIGTGAIVLIVAALAWAAGLGSSNDRSGPPPFFVTESEARAECMTGTFVPERAGEEIATKPPPKVWRQIEEAPGAVPAERGAVKVTLRPTKAGMGEEVTLTSIEFQVFDLGARPIGSIFYRPCARRPTGAAVETDLDGYDRQITATSADPNGSLRVGFHLPLHAQPIAFPWTVSLHKPLDLYLVVQALDIYCDWTAHISWTSDSGQGVIRVDNGGRKYRIVDGVGTGWEKPGANGQWGYPPGSSAWIGVTR